MDDSPVFRALLTQLIESDPDLEVVASAEDPYQARELIKRYSPDVLTLDIEMPRMNGVQFLKISCAFGQCGSDDIHAGATRR